MKKRGEGDLKFICDGLSAPNELVEFGSEQSWDMRPGRRRGEKGT